MSASLAAQHPVTLERSSSIADGLLTLRPGDLTFAHVRRIVDEVVTVDDAEMIAAVQVAVSRGASRRRAERRGRGRRRRCARVCPARWPSSPEATSIPVAYAAISPLESRYLTFA